MKFWSEVSDNWEAMAVQPIPQGEVIFYLASVMRKSVSVEEAVDYISNDSSVSSAMAALAINTLLRGLKEEASNR